MKKAFIRARLFKWAISTKMHWLRVYMGGFMTLMLHKIAAALSSPLSLLAGWLVARPRDNVNFPCKTIHTLNRHHLRDRSRHMFFPFVYPNSLQFYHTNTD